MRLRRRVAAVKSEIGALEQQIVEIPVQITYETQETLERLGVNPDYAFAPAAVPAPRPWPCPRPRLRPPPLRPGFPPRLTMPTERARRSPRISSSRQAGAGPAVRTPTTTSAGRTPSIRPEPPLARRRP